MTWYAEKCESSANPIYPKPPNRIVNVIPKIKTDENVLIINFDNKDMLSFEMKIDRNLTNDVSKPKLTKVEKITASVK